MKVVVDTNVLLVANGQHGDVSLDCEAACIQYLLSLQENGTVVIDDRFLILGEYMHKTSLSPPKGVGDKFLKWLLRNSGSKRVEQVSLTELSDDCYLEFPDKELEARFDAPDRKFAAVSHAHPDKPTIWQAVDCKWLDWLESLCSKGINVEFLCPVDACKFYRKKFPGRPVPSVPK